MRLFFLIFICLFNKCVAQKVSKVFDFITVPTMMVNYKPIPIRLNGEDLYDYFSFYENPNRSKVTSNDSLALWEILSSIKDDTTTWKWKELPNTFIIRNDEVAYKGIDKNVHLKDSITKILKLMKEKPCHYGENSIARIYSISRPIFDKSRTYSLVQYNLLNCENEGSIKVKFYRKVKDNWVFIDNILSLKRQVMCNGAAQLPSPIK